MKRFTFTSNAFVEYNRWAVTDVKIFKKIVELLNNINSTPFKGLGKPEPLKYREQGCWSRRINLEHRLVYKVTDSEIIIISCCDHY